MGLSGRMIVSKSGISIREMILGLGLFMNIMVSYKAYRRGGYDDIETIKEEIRKEKFYGRYPGQDPSSKKRSQQTGIIMIITGIIIIILIIASFYSLLGNATFLLVLICSPLPIFFIIMGILLLFNKRSGKLLFAVMCIVLGIGGLIISILSLFVGEFDERSGGATGVSFGIMIYGFYLFRRHMKG